MPPNDSPNRGRVQLNVWIDRGLRDELRTIADAKDTKSAQIVRGLVRDYVAAEQEAVAA